MAKTLQQRFIQALKARGEQVVENRSRYAVMTYSKTIKCQLPLKIESSRYYIGSHGSLRVGKTYTESRPVVESLKWVLLNEAQD